MPAYPHVANPDLLARIPLDAGVVLDVGCGSGALGAAYKRLNPAARYLGIERDPEAARAAARVLDAVAVADLERGALPFEGERVDCLVYGDVLEHLREPWQVLRRQLRCLAEDGTILICMPNVEHWSFAEALLRGTFDYADQGLFDRTHLRWYSYETTRRALLELGLVPFDVAPRIVDGAAAENFARAMRPALDVLGIDPAHYLHRAAPIQHVWRVRRRKARRLNVVSTMLKPVGGVSTVRVTEPIRALATDPTIVARVVNEPDVETLPEEPTIFILHRPLLTGEAGMTALRRLLARGHLLVCEFDDHPDYIPGLHRPSVLNFRGVHAIQTTTQPLAAELAKDNPEVAVFPNAIFQLPEVRNHADPARQTLFFGGLNRGEEWPPLIGALNAVAAVARERLHFRIVNDRALFDALQTPHKSFTPLCDYDTYLDLLANSEISFMPLRDTPFNRCKSDLKYLEAAAARVTALASPVAYGDTVEDGRTGVLFRDAAELQQRLLRLVANPEIGQAIGEAGRAYIAKHRMLAYQVGRRTAWYAALWERRAELHAALLARLPALAVPEGTA